jgi:hypothetical protein
MSDPAEACRACRAPAGDAYLCDGCTTLLEQTIAELPAKLRELEVTVTRQARVGNTPRARLDAVELLAAEAEHRSVPARLRGRDARIALAETRLPFHEEAAHLATLASDGVRSWALLVAATRGLTIPRTSSPQDRCVWLVANMPDVRQVEAAVKILRRAGQLSRRIDGMVDRHAPDVFAGRCDAKIMTTISDHRHVLVPAVVPCGTDLYAHDGDQRVDCGSCGTGYDVAALRATMREKVADVWARPHTIANALTGLDEPVKPDTLRKWIERDKTARERWQTGDGPEPTWPLVLQVGIDDDGRALYRVGDVQARIAWQRERTDTRRSA